MSVLASIANLFPQPSLFEPGKSKKDGFSIAFASAVAVSLRRNDFMEGCG
jgi:hypothetical protein